MQLYRRAGALLLALTLLLAACSSAQPGTPAPSPTENQSSFATAPVDEPSPTAETPTGPALTPSPQSPEPSPTAPAAEDLPLSRYTLAVDLDYTQRIAAVSEEIAYVNRSGEAIPDLLLDVEPTYYTEAFTLTDLRWKGGDPINGTRWEGAWLHVPLAQPLQPGEQIDLSLAYTLNLPTPVVSDEVRPVPFGATERQINLVDWYPFFPPYVPGSGWLVHPAGFYGEHLAYEMADFEVSLRLVDGRGDLTVAASAPAEVDGDRQRYRLPAARNFALSVSHLYQVSQQQVGDITVLGYSFPAHAAGGERALQTTAEALSFYQEKFAPYPHRTLTVVEADFLDGMEYEGLYFLSYGFYNLYSGTPGEYLVAIAAHETAHQWWYGLVGNDQALEPWLDEALCTYSERLYYERYYPDALQWWWAYRVNYYEPRGWVDTSIYNPEKSAQPYRDYRDAVYLNGAVFLEELRQSTGDEAFFAFLADYARQFSGRLATRADFFNILSRHTSVDLTPLIAKYFSSK